jgi:hypothetical protein
LQSVQDEAEETRTILVTKVPAQMAPAAPTHGEAPDEAGKPRILVAGRTCNQAAHRFGEATDVKKEPGRVHEAVLVAVVHRDAVAGRRHDEAAGSAKDGRLSFGPNRRFRAIVWYFGAAGARILFA